MNDSEVNAIVSVGIIYLVVLVVGCVYISIGCNKNYETSCINFNIVHGKVKNTFTTQQTNKNGVTTYYANENVIYGSRSCTVSHPTPYYFLADAVSYENSIKLNQTEYFYALKAKQNICYRSGIAEYNFTVGFVLLLICASPVFCFLCMLLYYYVKGCINYAVHAFYSETTPVVEFHDLEKL
jgi:hypothetical protein